MNYIWQIEAGFVTFAKPELRNEEYSTHSYTGSFKILDQTVSSNLHAAQYSVLTLLLVCVKRFLSIIAKSRIISLEPEPCIWIQSIKDESFGST